MANIPLRIMLCIAMTSGASAAARMGLLPHIGAAKAQTAKSVPVGVQIIGVGKERRYFMTVAWVKSRKVIRGATTEVKSGPGQSYPTIDTLPANAVGLQLQAEVGWNAIVYPTTKPAFGSDFDIATACGLNDPPPASMKDGVAYTGPCRVGWVLKRHLNFGET